MLDHHIAHDVVGRPVGRLRPGIGVLQTAHAHFHQQWVLGKDRSLAGPIGLIGVGRHPIHAVIAEQGDPIGPAFGIEHGRLAKQQRLHLVHHGWVDLGHRLRHIALCRNAGAAHVVGRDRFGTGHGMHRLDDDAAAQGLLGGDVGLAHVVCSLKQC